MPNRFLETNYFKSPFVKRLSGKLKCFYSYIICDCTASGIWFLDLDAAKHYTGFDITMQEFEENFVETGKAKQISQGKFFFKDFIEHQYPGGLSDTNKAHKNILTELRKFNLLGDNNLPIKEAPLKESLKASLKDPLQGVQGIGIGNGNGNGIGNGNKRAEKKFNKNPSDEECSLELPKTFLKQAIENLDINFHIKKTEGQVLVMWESFKLENFDGINFYENENKIFTHFLRSIKNYTNGAANRANNPKPELSYDKP